MADACTSTFGCPSARVGLRRRAATTWRVVSRRLSTSICLKAAFQRLAQMFSPARFRPASPGRNRPLREGDMVFRAIYDKIKAGLAKTRGVFSGIASLFRLRGRVDRDFLAELEKRLYLADVGNAAVAEIVDRVRQAYLDKEVNEDVIGFVKGLLREQLTAEGIGLNYAASGPTVILVAGVNGSGKTTSIAKLARWLQGEEGKKVVVAACDTFRAAAVEQLTIWTQRVGGEIVKNQQ